LTAVADKAAALFNICLALGNIIAPILGGWLVDALGGVDSKESGGFQKAANVMSSVLLLNLIVFSIMNFLVLPAPLTKLTDGSILPNSNQVPVDPSVFKNTALKGETAA
jgi:MFS family permease